MEPRLGPGEDVTGGSGAGSSRSAVDSAPGATSDVARSGDGHQQDDRLSSGSLSRFAWRVRLGAVVACLAALAFIQSPGRIAADTKLDLAINPGGLLSSSLHLWDPQSFAGSLQNQAYGYLWPMGPFFWLGDTVGIPAWIVQRLWWATLLALAFLGMVRLIRLLDLGGPTVRILAGLSYALSPMLLTKLGPISSEVLPFALAPWVLVPLVMGSRSGSVRRSAALSGLAFFCIGGVNAVAAIAVLPIGAVWIATRSAGRRRRALAGWWTLAVTLASLWWLLPLLLLGRYSPPFLDWIESASITTLVTDPLTVLRGAGDWVGYLSAESGPVWSLGYAFSYNSVLLVSSSLIVVFGLLGLCYRNLPERGFIGISLLVGFTLVSLGHTSGPASPIQGLTQSAFDGVLAPLRNVHKFDPVLRIALVLAMAWLLTMCAQKLEAHALDRGWKKSRYRLPLIGVVGVLAMTVFATLVAGVTTGRSYEGIPDYWRDASAYMAEKNPEGRALVVPSASAAQFQWGRTQDEPLQAIGDVAWDVRDSVPLGNAGHTRLLEEISARLEDGRGSAGLATVLERAGVQWIVVRNDIDQQMVDIQSTNRIHRALEGSPGIEVVGTFGPVIDDYLLGEQRQLSPQGIPYHAVEVFQVGSLPAPQAQLRSVDGALEIVGGAEAQYSLAAAGVLDDRVTVEAGDVGYELIPTTAVATNTLRKRENNFGFIRGSKSNTLTHDDAWLQDRPVRDYLDSDQNPVVLAELDGILAVDASSSASQATTYLARDQSAQPFAALDGDPQTAWKSADTGANAIGQWWSVTFPNQLALNYVDIELPKSNASQRTITLDTGNQTIPVVVDGLAQSVRVPLGGDPTQSLRLELTDSSGDIDQQFVISEVSVPGLEPTRPMRTFSDGPVRGAVLSATAGGRPECVDIGGQYRCAEAFGRVGEDRSGIDQWVWFEAGSYVTSAAVRPRGSPEFSEFLESEAGLRASGSSTEYEDFVSSPGSAVDGIPQTAWYPSGEDDRPRLEIELPDPVEVTSVTIDSSQGPGLSSPLSVTIDTGATQTRAFVDATTTVQVPAALTDSVVIWIDSVRPAYVSDLDETRLAPFGIAEVGINSATEGTASRSDWTSASAQVPVTCGEGIDVKVSGSKPVALSGSFTAKEALESSAFELSPCGGNRTIEIDSGWHRIVAKSTDTLIVDRIDVLPAEGLPPTGRAAQVDVVSWDETDRSVAVAAESSGQVLETGESFNQGWTARLGDQKLTAIEVDGWRQGWVVPAGSAGVVALEFAPDSLYRGGLVVGFLSILALIGLALVRSKKMAPPGVSDGARPWMLTVTLLGVCLILWNPVVLVLAALTAWAAQRLFAPRTEWRIWLIAVGGFTLVALQLAMTQPISTRSPDWVESISVYVVAVVLWVALGSWSGIARRSGGSDR